MSPLNRHSGDMSHAEGLLREGGSASNVMLMLLKCAAAVCRVLADKLVSRSRLDSRFIMDLLDQEE